MSGPPRVGRADPCPVPVTGPPPFHAPFAAARRRTPPHAGGYRPILDLRDPSATTVGRGPSISARRSRQGTCAPPRVGQPTAGVHRDPPPDPTSRGTGVPADGPTSPPAGW